jgi:hypothetical protein
MQDGRPRLSMLFGAGEGATLHFDSPGEVSGWIGFFYSNYSGN